MGRRLPPWARLIPRPVEWLSGHRAARRGLVVRIALPLASVMFLGLFASVLLLKFAASHQDERAQAREVRSITAILATRSRLLETMVRGQAEAPRALTGAWPMSPDELDALLRSDQTTMGFDGAAVLDPDGAVVAAISREGTFLDPAGARHALGTDSSDILVLARGVSTITGNVLWEGVPALMVATVPPDAPPPAAPVAPHLRPVLIYVEQMDAALLSRIARLLGLSGLYLGAPASDQASLPITDLSGRQLASLVWQPSRPGTALLDDVLNPILAIFGILGAASAAVIWLARHAASLIRASELRALSDPLTGLPNRFLLEDRLQHALLTMRRNQERITLLYLDLDGFKRVNDTLGHAAGDDLLRQAADRLRSLVRDMDTVARIGGDEFIVFQPGDCNAATIHQICVRLIDGLAEPFIVDGKRIDIGVSIGAVCAPADGTEVSLLVRRADEAMYHAKRSGRGRYHRWSDTVRSGGVFPGAGSSEAMT
ncbi:MAG TPA: diguanylate cyclase [Geminicoccus sp.]|nr:diguanylate cyclase [Geminicoccus sp.]